MPPISSTIERIPCSSIDWRNLTYAFRFPAHDDTLFHSIQQHGLLALPGLLCRHKKYSIIYGHKRLWALRRLKQKTITANCYTGTLSPEQIVDLVIADNQMATMHLLDKARLCGRIRQVLKLDRVEFLKRYADRLQMSGSIGYLEILEKITQMGDRIKQAFYLNQIFPDKIEVLTRCTRPDQDLIFQAIILNNADLSKSSFAQLADILRDLKIKHKVSIKILLGEPACAAIVANPKITPQQKGQQVLDHFRKKRYPVLTLYQQEFEKEKNRLLAPYRHQAQLSAAPYFEDDQVALQFKTNDQAVLLELCRHYAQEIERGNFKKIFKLLRGSAT